VQGTRQRQRKGGCATPLTPAQKSDIFIVPLLNQSHHQWHANRRTSQRQKERGARNGVGRRLVSVCVGVLCVCFWWGWHERQCHMVRTWFSVDGQSLQSCTARFRPSRAAHSTPTHPTVDLPPPTLPRSLLTKLPLLLLHRSRLTRLHLVNTCDREMTPFPPPPSHTQPVWQEQLVLVGFHTQSDKKTSVNAHTHAHAHAHAHTCQRGVGLPPPSPLNRRPAHLPLPPSFPASLPMPSSTRSTSCVCDL
jgi:hypothetical protein